MAQSFDKLKELNLSRDEVERIGDALKKEEFRKLFVEYVEELQDPKNKKLYEDEITQLEKERGIDVTFIHPKPGYVIKTSVNGSRKAFVNICVNDLIKKPLSSPAVREGAKGLSWSLPHSLSPPREDTDNKGVRCQVFDVVFHSDTLHLAEKNVAFKTMVNSTALEAVENNFDVKLDKKNLKFPKLNYKGMPHPSIIRKPSDSKPIERDPEVKDIYDQIYAQAKTFNSSPVKKQKKARDASEDKSNYTIPKYLIKHRSHVDIQEFTEHRDAKMNSATPKELVVEISLPLLKSSSDITLDVTEKTVQLKSEKPAKYKLNLTLPYRVNENSGNAKFDKDLKKLVITLPVRRKTTFGCESDSGVESDHCSPATPESEEDISEKFSEKTSKIFSEKQYENKQSDKRCSENLLLRTNFLNENLHYSLPEFFCNLFENVVAFTLNVKNVDESSVEKLLNDNSIHVKFTSIGSSFYPSYYSFYVKFPLNEIDAENTTVEVWDNNVILQVPIISCDNKLVSFFYGANESDLSEKYFEEPEIINKVLEEIQNKKEGERKTEILNQNSIESLLKIGEKDGKSKEVTALPNISENLNWESQEKYPRESSPCDNHRENNKERSLSLVEPTDSNEQSTAIDIVGTSYESSGDELSCCSYSPKKCKGILKRASSKRFAVGRSVSESSIDDFMFSSSLENFNNSLDSVIPEDKEVSTSLKKTVRFNDAVTRQLFRSNSSILGQKKKNQRKAKNKKRALERRHSESEASECDEKRERDLNDCKQQFGTENEQTNGLAKEEHHIFQIDIDN